MKFTQIPESTFQELQLNAGILAFEFDPANGTLDKANMMGATTGGINFVATPSFVDFGEDIDNCPKNTMELKKLEAWEVKMSGTFVSINAASAKTAVGAADIDETDATKIVPRNDIAAEDFKDLWWIGDYSDKNGDENGGFVAIHMLNSLSTGGFQIQSTDKGKGQFKFEFTAHYSIEDQSRVPFEVYIKAGTKDTTSATTEE